MSQETGRTRCRVACDACGFETWIGADGPHHDAWCEGCQKPARVSADSAPEANPPPCQACGERLTCSAPRFEELWGELQNLTAVLEAWLGDSQRLASLVPERPRFLADLDPPGPMPHDPPALRRALEALRAGSFREARAKLEDLLEGAHAALGRSLAPDVARAWFALGVACHRLEDARAAEAAYTRALEADTRHENARLDRAVLRARRGDFTGSLEDLDRLGDRREVRWNRAAAIVHEVVAAHPGSLDTGRLEEARRWAGPPSDYWSDPTVGRLAFTLVAERARTHREEGRFSDSDRRALLQAEDELEFSTFTDRAMVLATYATLPMDAERAPAARGTAYEVTRSLRAFAFVRGPHGRPLAEALEEVARAVSQDRPEDALLRSREMLGRTDLARYRIPCVRCGRGTIGVDRLEDGPGEEPRVPA